MISHNAESSAKWAGLAEDLTLQIRVPQQFAVLRPLAFCPNRIPGTQQTTIAITTSFHSGAMMCFLISLARKLPYSSWDWSWSWSWSWSRSWSLSLAAMSGSVLGLGLGLHLPTTATLSRPLICQGAWLNEMKRSEDPRWWMSMWTAVQAAGQYGASCASTKRKPKPKPKPKLMKSSPKTNAQQQRVM